MRETMRTTVQTIEEIPALLSDPEAVLYAGGTVTAQRYPESYWVDLSEVPGLSGIRERGTRLEIGALTTLEKISGDTRVRDCCPALAEAAAAIPDDTVRARGTIGGNIADREIPGDLLSVLIAANAQLMIKTDADYRECPIDRLYDKKGNLKLAEDEVILRVTLPIWLDAVSFYTVSGERDALKSNRVSAAVQLLTGEDGQIVSVRAAMIGSDSKPIRLLSLERALKGKPFTPETFQNLSSLQIPRENELLNTLLENCAVRAAEKELN